MDRREFLECGASALLVGAPAFQGGAGTPAVPSGGRAGVAPAGDAAAVQKSLEQRARAVFQKNRVECKIGLFHLPSAQSYRSFFAWDSGWNIITLSLLDPELACRELMTVFNVQCADGHVPHEVRVSELSETELSRRALIWLVRRQYDEQGRSHFIDPPCFLLAAAILFTRTGDQRVLALLPGMERCAEYLTGARDLFGDGLVSIIHPWESGTDSAPVFDAPLQANVKSPLFALDYAFKYPALLNHCARLDWDLAKIARSNQFVFEDVGMNAITAAGLLGLAGLYERAGRHDKAQKWSDRARSMVAAMEELLWDEEAGFFFPRYDLKRRVSSKRTCLTGLLPLITGLVSEDKARRVIEHKLLSPGVFYGPWLVPFNSISELAKERVPFEEAMLWRGHCIWMNMNWLAALAASRYGRDEVAREITRQSAVMVAGQGFREFYDPRTGRGGGAAGFTWPGLVLDMIERYGL